ncbi:Vacuolar protein sorting 4a [Giardia muris]|uniref:Vacuolar protein sorting 4a n=1 Tax=Giardia muris TaxID=5742 RepID=A0A4Z1T821_GIAMU|nr:Vacuolar protein sorting 4a [Giardia muris]|eukprot:TNJ29317.1 Vacuolar protein sorting 4a [Giardia muris]
MSQQDLIAGGLNDIKKASDIDKDGRKMEALELYKRGCKLVVRGLKECNDQKRVGQLSTYLNSVFQRIEALKKILGIQSAPSTPASPAPPALNEQSASDKSSNSRQPEDKSAEKAASGKQKKDPLEDALSRVIVREKPNIHWDDVVGLQSAKDALNEAVILPIKFPHLFEGKREPWRGILLYGCPGTGKSFLAKALATECDATFFSVSSSDLISKYVGESARLIRALFDMARKEPQAIIFIDEIDALVSSRGGGEESDASRQVKTEFLVQMQGVGKGAGNLLVLGATNFPEAIDSAMLRRFEKRIEVSLPGPEARANILKNGIGATLNALTDADFELVAGMTNDYSGSDLSVICKEALMSPIRLINKATHFRLSEVTGKYEPCGSDIPGAQRLSMIEIPSDKLAVPYITLSHLLEAVRCAKSSVSEHDKKRIAQFTEEYRSA